MSNKLYRSKSWLARKYLYDKLSENEIANLCGTTQVTVNYWLRKHGIKNNV